MCPWSDKLLALRSSSVQFNHSVVADSLWTHGLQHARPPCPSLIPRAYSNSCPLSGWCHPTILSSVVPFSCLQFFAAWGSFPMSQFFISGGPSTRVPASASVLPMNIQDCFPWRWTGWISKLSKGLSRSSPTPQFKSINSLVLSFLYSPTFTSIHDNWENHSFSIVGCKEYYWSDFGIVHLAPLPWPLIPLPFLNPAWTSGSSQFMYLLIFMYLMFMKLGLKNFEHYFASM